MLREMTAREFAEWEAFYAIDPFGDQRADLRAGIVAATVSNRWRGRNEDPKAPSDFMPFKQDVQQTPDEIQRQLRNVLAQVKKHG